MNILVISEGDHVSDAIADGLADAGFKVTISKWSALGTPAKLGDEYDLLVVHDDLKCRSQKTVKKVVDCIQHIPVLMTPLSRHTDPIGLAKKIYARNKNHDLGRSSPTIHLSSDNQNAKLQVTDLIVNLANGSVSRNGQKIYLAPLAFKLLVFLMKHEGEVVSKETLLRKVWGFDFEPNTTMVATQLSRLRRRIDHGFRPRLIHSVRGKGYCLRVVPDLGFNDIFGPE